MRARVRTERAGTERRLTMRLGWRDGSASLFVIAAGVLYALWQSGTALQGMSTRALGAVVFALGCAACMIDRAEMAVVYGVGGRRRAPMAYIVVASVLGFAALVAGVITLVSVNETMLAILVATTVTLWAMSTVRHATAGGRHGMIHAIREPLDKAA
jgi:FtsH-binding integral membrane protein